MRAREAEPSEPTQGALAPRRRFPRAQAPQGRRRPKNTLFRSEDFLSELGEDSVQVCDGREVDDDGALGGA